MQRKTRKRSIASSLQIRQACLKDVPPNRSNLKLLFWNHLNEIKKIIQNIKKNIDLELEKSQLINSNGKILLHTGNYHIVHFKYLSFICQLHLKKTGKRVRKIQEWGDRKSEQLVAKNKLNGTQKLLNTKGWIFFSVKICTKI